MIRKLFILMLVGWFAVGLVLPLSPVSASALAKKEYHAERYDVLVEVQQGGAIRVTEAITFRFSGEPFTYVFRELNPVETDGFTGIQVAMDGQLLTQGTGAGQVEITGNRITWHFAPALNETHTFGLSYTALGVIRHGTEDELIWRAIPPDHDYSIAQSLITLQYPSSITPLSNPTIDERDPTIEAQPGLAMLEVNAIEADEELILRAAFPSGSLVTTSPQWQTRQQESRQALDRALPFGFGAGIISLLLLCVALMAGYTHFFRREESLLGSEVNRVYNPPDDLPPALAARLAQPSQGPMLALATLFDLARRGLVRIEELPRRFLSKDFAVIREADNPALLPHEQALWELLFISRRGPRDSLRGSEMGNLLSSQLGRFDRALNEELLTRGLIDPERKRSKTIFAWIGVMLLVFSIAGFIAGLGLGGSSAEVGDYTYYPIAAALVGFAISLLIAAIVAFIQSGAASPLTPQGEIAAARWRGFNEYLKDITKSREAAIRPDMFQMYLPLAAGIGLAAGWAKIFEKTGNLELPGWFRPLNNAAHADFGSFVAVISSASSSASSASAGGAGASGGGSSGAG